MMPLYAYKAMNAAGRIVAGHKEAANLVDLEIRLRHSGLDFINGGPARAGVRYGGGVARRELINFCFHLEQLTGAGVPIVEALVDLRDSVADARLRDVLAGMVDSIEGGATLSQALAENPRVFDPVMTGLIRAGEDTGKLPEVLASLVDALKWQDELAAYTRRLVLYPSFVGVVTLALLFFVMIYLVPKLVGFMANMGQKLPMETEILIAVAGFVGAAWPWLLLAPVLAAAAGHVAIRSDARVRRSFDAMKLRVPLVGAILHKIILARFAATFAMMYAAGISILDALRATENVAGNAVVKEGLQRAGAMIRDGESLTAAFQRIDIFPPLVLRMLRVGENTGDLDRALRNVGYFYNRDVRESVERAQTLIEPVLTVTIGLVMGWIMLSVLGPIYDVIARLKT